MKLAKVAISFAVVAALGSCLYYLNQQQSRGQWKTRRRVIYG